MNEYEGVIESINKNGSNMSRLNDNSRASMVHSFHIFLGLQYGPWSQGNIIGFYAFMVFLLVRIGLKMP